MKKKIQNIIMSTLVLGFFGVVMNNWYDRFYGHMGYDDYEKIILDLIVSQPKEANRKENRVKLMSMKSIDCHTTNIYHEARNQSEKGQKAVFMVVMNRVEQKAKTPCDVISEPNQFSWTLEKVSITDKKVYNDIKNRVRKWSRSYNASATGIDHYHRYDINPKWNRNMERVARIDDHVFFKSK